MELPLFPSLLHLSSPLPSAWLAFPSHEQCPSELCLSVPTLKHLIVAPQPIGFAEQHQGDGCQWAGAALFLQQLLHHQPSADTGPWMCVWGGVCVTVVPFLLPLGVLPAGQGWFGPGTAHMSCQALSELSQICSSPAGMEHMELPFQGTITHPDASNISFPYPPAPPQLDRDPNGSFLPVLPSPSSLMLHSVCHHCQPVPT